MPPTLTNCVVSKNGVEALTNPASAELYDEMAATMHIITTGGTVAQSPVLNNTYKVSGRATRDRTFIGLVLKSAASPYRFNTPTREDSAE